MNLPASSSAAALFLLAAYVKATLVFGAAWAVAGCLRKRSAAARHQVWAVATLAALALPLLTAVLPSWHSAAFASAVGGLSRGASTASDLISGSTTVVKAVAGRSAYVNWAELALVIWAAGFCALLLRLVVGFAGMLTVEWRSTILLGRDWMQEVGEISRAIGVSRPVRLLRSSASSEMPLAWGIFSPKILVPSAASQWSEDRRRIVLLHELAHIARHDCTIQILAQFMRAFYWLNPFAWLSTARLRRESESACDDTVLNSGVEASRYADHLLVLARTLDSRSNRWIPALAMARTSHLERRFSSMLNSTVDRRLSSKMFKILTVLIAACILIPLAAVRLPAQTESGTFTGTIYDPSAAAVPNATIIMIGQSGTRDMTTSDASGSFQFANLPAGHYEMEVLKPGFKPYIASSVSLEAGRDLSQDATLAMGDVEERVEVQGQGVAASNAAGAQNSKRIRIGGSVEAAQLLTQVMPVYPGADKAAGSEGTVILSAVIGKDGTPLSLHVVNGQIDPLLARSAVEAVSHWRYRPTLLNGQPVEVKTEISVVYSLKR